VPGVRIALSSDILNLPSAEMNIRSVSNIVTIDLVNVDIAEYCSEGVSK
jgi:hypothetical protein